MSFFPRRTRFISGNILAVIGAMLIIGGIYQRSNDYETGIALVVAGGIAIAFSIVLWMIK